MNAIFSFQRFENYIKRNLIFTKGQYLYLIAIVLGAYLFSMLFFFATTWSLAPLLMAGTIITVMIGPCILEPKISKYNGVMEYTFPVSTFERFLAFWIKYVLILPLLTYGVYYLLSVVTELLPFDALYKFKEGMNIFRFFDYKVLLAILGIQSMYMVGYLTFNRHPFLKTVLSIFVMNTVLMGMLMFITYTTFSHLSLDFMNIEAIGEGQLGFIQKLPVYFGLSVFPFGFWVVSFFKIREKEV